MRIEENPKSCFNVIRTTETAAVWPFNLSTRLPRFLLFHLDFLLLRRLHPGIMANGAVGKSKDSVFVRLVKRGSKTKGRRNRKIRIESWAFFKHSVVSLVRTMNHRSRYLEEKGKKEITSFVVAHSFVREMFFVLAVLVLLF